MTMLRWSTSLLAVAAVSTLALSTRAEAQSVVIEGQVQVQPYGQPQGYVQPPPGYGGQVQVYQQQPVYQAQPVYQQPYQPVQRQVVYEEQTSTIKGLWIPGIIVFGVSYVLGGFTGMLSWDGTYSDWMWVPVVGPWVAAGYSNSQEELTGAILGGVLQAAGLTMFILGLSIQRTVRVARYALDDSDRSPELAFDILPAAGGGQLGLTLSHF